MSLRIRWTLLAAFTAYLLLGEILPRAVHLGETYSAYQLQNDRVRLSEAWEVELDRVEGRRAELQASFSARYGRMPRTSETAVVMGAVQAAARDAGAVLVALRPTETISADTHDELSIELQASGTFHALAGFVDRLERADYGFGVAAVEMRKDRPVMATLRLKVTMLKPGGAS